MQHPYHAIGFQRSWREIQIAKRNRAIKNALWVLLGVVLTLFILGLAVRSDIVSLYQ